MFFVVVFLISDLMSLLMKVLMKAQEMLYPLIDDPYLLGRISCTAILSNMYAVGVTEVYILCVYVQHCTHIL